MSKIDELKEYHTRTSKNGIIMPDIESFDTKTKLAIKLWPQINGDGRIDYLLGKGLGVELALRGKVKGRKKYNNNFPYRSHSDFEIYNAPYTSYDSIPESKAFTYVFGGQEIYPKSATKGLHELPPSLMDSTYEEVEYNGETFLIPELEILFLDKYLKQESTPRSEGCDAILLLKEYDLSLEKILNYFDEYYINPESKKIQENYNFDKMYNQSLISLNKRMINSCKDYCEEEGIEFNLETLNKYVNKKISSFKRISPSINVDGIIVSLCPDNIEYVLEDGKFVISKNTEEVLKENIKDMVDSKIQKLQDEREELIEVYNRVNKTKKTRVQ